MARTDIIAEMIVRLETIGPPVKRGYGGVQVDRFPSIWLFEDEEKTIDGASSVLVNSKHRGKLQKSLPLIIEYFERVSNVDKAYEKGNELLQTVAQAVELDPYFTSSQSGRKLVSGYYMSNDFILPLRDGVVEVIMEYEFLYQGFHYGLT